MTNELAGLVITQLYLEGQTVGAGGGSTFFPPESAIFPACMQHCCYSVRCRHADINTHQHKHTNTQRHKPTHEHPNPQAFEHTNTSTRAHRGATKDSGTARGLLCRETGRTLASKRKIFFLDCRCPTWSVDCVGWRVFQLSSHTQTHKRTRALLT